MRAIKDKSWKSLGPVIVEMLTNDPAFEGVEVLYSDGESALSEENVRQLKTQVPRLRKVVRFKPQQGKAFAAERAIGLFKRVLSALLRRSDIWRGAPRAASLQDWRRVLVESVQVMNQQRRLAFSPAFSPAQVDRSNYLALENQANLHAYYPRPPPRPFGFALGALVTVKLVSLRRGGKAGRVRSGLGGGEVSGLSELLSFSETAVAFGNKLSLTGYNAQQACVIAARKWKPTGRRGSGRAAYYQGRPSRT